MQTIKQNIRKDDRVMVISGKEKGKIGKVLKFTPNKNRVLVEKVNMIKRHTKASASLSQAGIVEKEGSLPISNVMLVCPKCTDPVRVGRKILEDGSRIRYCRKCDEILDD